jgi:hypothetical protein
MGRHDDLDSNGIADFAEYEAWLSVKLARSEMCDGLEHRQFAPRASAPVTWGLDAAAALSVNDVKARGASFVCCYLAPSSQAWKVRSAAQIKAYTAAGLSVVFNWESDGTPGNGWSTGVSAARQAQVQLNDKGWPNAPVIFTFADSGNPNLAAVLAATQGAVSVLGWDRVGGYGGIKTIAYLADHSACKYFWQTYAWSSGRRDERAQLFQRLNGPQMDFDVAYAADFGQVPRPGLGSSPTSTPTARKVLRDMPERPFPAGDSGGRIICPTGKSSLLAGRSWFSASVDGTASVEVWAQVSGGGDTPAGAGEDAAAHRQWQLRRGDRPWFELPDGTEFVTYHVAGASGPGGVAVEQLPK